MRVSVSAPVCAAHLENAPAGAVVRCGWRLAQSRAPQYQGASRSMTNHPARKRRQVAALRNRSSLARAGEQMAASFDDPAGVGRDLRICAISDCRRWRTFSRRRSAVILAAPFGRFSGAVHLRRFGREWLRRLAPGRRRRRSSAPPAWSRSRSTPRLVRRSFRPLHHGKARAGSDSRLTDLLINAQGETREFDTVWSGPLHPWSNRNAPPRAPRSDAGCKTPSVPRERLLRFSRFRPCGPQNKC